MNEQEHNDFLKEFKKFTKEITKSKESSLKFLRNTGISTPTGRLKKAYSTPQTPSAAIS